MYGSPLFPFWSLYYPLGPALNVELPAMVSSYDLYIGLCAGVTTFIAVLPVRDCSALLTYSQSFLSAFEQGHQPYPPGPLIFFIFTGDYYFLTLD